MDLDSLAPLVDEAHHGNLDNILAMCNAPYAVENGIMLTEVSENFVKMRKVTTPGDLNSNGVVHGAAIFGLIDHTFGTIVNIRHHTVGQSCDVKYHRPCQLGEMEATATILNESRSLIIAEIRLHSNGKLIASAICTGFKVS